jgi:hypothetical protein
MLYILKKWDTFLILILIVSLIGGSTWSVKLFSDISKVTIDESIFFKQNIEKSELARLNPSSVTPPTSVIATKHNKFYYDSKGEQIKDIEPRISNLTQAPFVFSPMTDKWLPNQQSKLKELIPIPIKPEKYNYLYYPRFEINANIVYAQPSDYDIIDVGNPCSAKSINTPIQKLVRQGIVHIYGSPMPGEVRYPDDEKEYYGIDINGIKQYGNGIGSSYIVGHSSECLQHAYTRIFEPLQQRSSIGDEFYIYDPVGRKLKFKVFEVLTVDDTDTKTAYKEFPNKRIVTLQTSIFISKSNIKRWLTRGELILEN